MEEKYPQHNRKSLTSSPKSTINFVNTTLNTVSKHQVLIQLWSGQDRRDMGKSGRVGEQESLHTISGPTGYLCLAAVL